MTRGWHCAKHSSGPGRLVLASRAFAQGEEIGVALKCIRDSRELRRPDSPTAGQRVAIDSRNARLRIDQIGMCHFRESGNFIFQPGFVFAEVFAKDLPGDGCDAYGCFGIKNQGS